MAVSTFVMSQLSKIYEVNETSLQSNNACYSDVFEIDKKGEKRIIKLKKESQTNLLRLESEIRWLNHLKDSGISVAYPFPGISGRYIEKIDDDNESFYAISYIKAKGEIPRKVFSHHKCYPEDFLVNWGSYVGRMHKASKEFDYDPNNFSRPYWADTIDFFDLEDYPPSQKEVVKQFRKTIEKIENLDKSKDSFGLIHNDLLEDNMHLFQNELTAFDFEDSAFSWFVNDIAIALFYPVCMGKSDKEEQIEYGKYFMTNFMKGYRLHNALNPEAMGAIPLFLKVREMDNYSMFYSDPEAEKFESVRQFMKDRQKRIENEEPLLDLDFSRL